MQRQYERIAQIQIFHSYFKEGKAKNLNLQPSSSTKNIMDKYGLLLRAVADGVELYITKREEQNNLLQYLSDEVGVEEFEIDLFSSDFNFYTYTELPLNQIGLLEYSNESLESGNDGTMIMKQEFIENASTNKLGVITLNLKELIAQTSSGAAQFKIEFEARKTQWNYFILSQESMEGLRIVDKSDIKFDGPIEVTIANGSKAQKFTSGSKLLTMQELPDRKIELVQVENQDNVDEAPKVIIAGLPSADPNKIGITEIEGSQVATSEMYVYI